MRRAYVVVALLVLLLVLPVLVVGQDDAPVWDRFQIQVAPDNPGLPCPQGAALTTDGNGTLGGIIRDCDPATNLNASVFNFGLEDQSFVEVDRGVYFDSDSPFHSFNGYAQVRYDSSRTLFYACTSNIFSPTLVHAWRANNTLVTPEGGRLIMVKASWPQDEKEAQGGKCGISHIEGRSGEFHAVARINNDIWVLFNTVDFFENQWPSFITGLNGTSWPAPGSVSSGRAQGSATDFTPWIRAQNPPSSPKNDLEFGAFWPSANSVNVAFCKDWSEFPCFNPGFNMTDDRGYFTYRSNPGDGDMGFWSGGIDFMQSGTGQDSELWSAWLFTTSAMTGDSVSAEFGNTRRVSVLCMDALVWDSTQRRGFCVNQHDEVSLTEGLGDTGINRDIVGFTQEEQVETDGSIRWVNPCVWSSGPNVIVAFEAFDSGALSGTNGWRQVVVVGSTDGGETWRGLRPAVTNQHHSGDVRLPNTGNCVAYDAATDKIAVLYKVDEATDGDGGWWIASNDIHLALPSFREFDWAALIGEARANRPAESTAIFGISLEPWAAAWGRPMLVVQAFVTLFSVLAFAVIGMFVFKEPRIGGGVGASMGLFLSVWWGFAHYFFVFFIALIAVGIILVWTRYMERRGGGAGS